MSTLTVAVLQTALVWQDCPANIQQLTAQLATLKPVDLIVLPEMFASGFSMDSTQIAEPEPGPALCWMQAQAVQYQCAITGSLAVRTQAGALVNRLYFVTPDGQVQHYDKRHLFRMAGEHQAYQAGRERVIVSYRGWRMLLQVCYDLRFPVFSRNCGDYDAMIYVANWPAARSRAWWLLLQARAIENQAYVFGCNRVGLDGNAIEYAGDSLIVDYLGQPLAELAPAQAGVLYAVADLAALATFRAKFPAQMDADDFSLS
ncbi:amidohydrolase [Alishewanella longhuensis]